MDPALRYDEARLWTYYLKLFTPGDLAASMGVTAESVEGIILGLAFNGTIEDTGGRMSNGEPVYEFVALPAGPTVHPTLDPEWSAAPGVGALAPKERGHAVRIRTRRDMGRLMSTPGLRGKAKRREQRYQASQKKPRKDR